MTTAFGAYRYEDLSPLCIDQDILDSMPPISGWVLRVIRRTPRVCVHTFMEGVLMLTFVVLDAKIEGLHVAISRRCCYPPFDLWKPDNAMSVFTLLVGLPG